jgi:hypothetical protein
MICGATPPSESASSLVGRAPRAPVNLHVGAKTIRLGDIPYNICHTEFV